MGKPKKKPHRFNLPSGRNSKKNKQRVKQFLETNHEEQKAPIKLNLGKKINHLYTCSNVAGLSLKFKRQEPVMLNDTGNRVVSVQNLGIELLRLTYHAAICPAALVVASRGNNPFKFLGVGKSAGLACYFHSRCMGCGKRFIFCSSDRLITPNGNSRYSVNVRGVWGQMVTGGGGSHLQEQMATLNIPALQLTNFTTIEDDIRVWWENQLRAELKLNGVEEKRLAVENGEFHEGVPSITVITDGGWSKRTHKHTYNALGGVAVIFGARTGKLLHIGVRCKQCQTCSLHKARGSAPPKHECFKNWSLSSQSMESDIILEGFQQCEESHGVRYTQLIGDGDSSTYAKLISSGPPWCRYIKKIECANHATKCLRSHLEKLVTDNENYKGKHGLTRHRRAHIVTYIRYAIRRRSQLPNHQEACKLLAKDIRTSFWHVFGRHRHCNPDICKGHSADKLSVNPTGGSDINQPNNSYDFEEILLEQYNFCKEGSTEIEQEESRKTICKPFNISNNIVKDLSSILNRLALKTPALVSNNTTNLCESWMALRAKFDGGKQINRCGKASWFARCYGAALRSSLGPEWSPKVWEAASKQAAGDTFSNCYSKRSVALSNSKKSKARPDVRRRAIKRKYERLNQSQTKAAKIEYGAECIQVIPDVSTDKLEDNCLMFFESKVRKSKEAIQIIKQNTREQSLDGLWFAERGVRLTSSNFGAIVKRRENLSVTPLVKRLLYSTFKGNRFTDYGLLQEENTIEAYKNHMLSIGKIVTVKKCGLVICKERNFLACSPDGIVTECDSEQVGLLEMKNLLMGKKITLQTAASNSKTFCLQKAKNGSLSLKTSHPYFFQCQGQLAVCDMPWVDFVVRTTNPSSIHVQRITFDQSLWINTVLPKLTAFYFEAYLPELSVPRNGKEPGLREQQKGLNSRLRADVLPFIPQPSTSGSTVDTGNKRQTEGQTSSKQKKLFSRVKFVGKKINHKWVLDEQTQECKWYKGNIIKVLKGRDGTLNKTVYEVLYDGEDSSYELSRREIIEDLNEGSLEFVDN